MELYRCARCKGTFWEDEMAPKRDSQGIRYTYCRDCHNARLREYYTKNSKKLRAYKDQWRKDHPHLYVYYPYDEKASARRKVSWAVTTGKLVPQPCEVCSNTNSRAHHDNYNRPLDVRWLCPLHHKEVHHQ